MRLCGWVASSLWAGAFATCLCSVGAAFGQASYAAQVRGVVKDQSGAMITGATVTITNDATGISTTAHSDANGLYILTGLRPAVYTLKAEKAGFRNSPSAARAPMRRAAPADLPLSVNLRCFNSISVR